MALRDVFYRLILVLALASPVWAQTGDLTQTEHGVTIRQNGAAIQMDRRSGLYHLDLDPGPFQVLVTPSPEMALRLSMGPEGHFARMAAVRGDPYFATAFARYHGPGNRLFATDAGCLDPDEWQPGHNALWPEERAGGMYLVSEVGLARRCTDHARQGPFTLPQHIDLLGFVHLWEVEIGLSGDAMERFVIHIAKDDPAR